MTSNGSYSLSPVFAAHMSKYKKALSEEKEKRKRRPKYPKGRKKRRTQP